MLHHFSVHGSLTRAQSGCSSCTTNCSSPSSVMRTATASPASETSTRQLSLDDYHHPHHVDGVLQHHSMQHMFDHPWTPQPLPPAPIATTRSSSGDGLFYHMTAHQASASVRSRMNDATDPVTDAIHTLSNMVDQYRASDQYSHLLMDQQHPLASQMLPEQRHGQLSATLECAQGLLSAVKNTLAQLQMEGMSSIEQHELMHRPIPVTLPSPPNLWYRTHSSPNSLQTPQPPMASLGADSLITARRRRRRLSHELPEREIWRCPFAGCTRFYCRSSTTSIRQHMLDCRRKPPTFRTP